MSDSLATIEKAQLALSKLRADLVNAKDFDEVKTVRDQAKTLKDVLTQMRAELTLCNQAASIWFRARRRVGEMLKRGQETGQLYRRGGYRESKSQGGILDGSKSQGGILISKLEDIEITLNESSRSHMLADVVEAIFEQADHEILEQDVLQYTMALLVSTINQLLNKQVDHPTVPPGKFSTLVVDPPWEMQKIARVKYDLQAGFDYPTMTIDKMKEYPIKELAADSAHLYLWTTHKHLPFAFELAEAWGFAYECLMTWVKNVGFTPYSWMRSTEHVLFCKRGGLPLAELGLRLDFKADRRKHSRKPDEFYDLVKRVSPEPRIDIFSREPRDGFEQAGNQIDQFKETADVIELQGQ